MEDKSFVYPNPATGKPPHITDEKYGQTKEIMGLVTLKTYSERTGIKRATLITWYNKRMEAFEERPKDIEFTHKMIHFVVIDGRPFVDTSKTKMTKKMYRELFAR